MRKTVNIHEAKTHFSELVNAATEGAEIFIAKAGKPVARLVSLEKEKSKVKFGLLKGKFKLSKNFDDPLSDDEMNLFEGN